MSAQFLNRPRRTVKEPRFVEWLLSSPWAGLIWLLPRLWVGYNWINASRGKLANPDWMKTGVALKGFWESAVAVPATGHPPIAFDWYRAFLQFLLNTQSYTWFAKVVTFGEMLVGIALILGAFTGIAAFCGAFMNWNFMMAGSASTNPMLFVFSIGFILAWKVAGYIGLDFFLLPWLGTPWRSSTQGDGQTPAGSGA